MKQISISEARNLILDSDAKYVSQEQPSVYYDNFSGDLALDAYITCGCLAIKTDSYWHIHATSIESDVCSAMEEVKEIMDLNAEKLMVLTWSSIPEELKDKKGAYKFARGYMPYSDQSIRQLTEEDYEQVRNCCAYDPDDNRIGQIVASDFLKNYNDFIKDSNAINLGLFIDNSLVGLVQSFEQNLLGISTINIYVNRQQRKKGYAKRLLSAICATTENTVYCYSCAKNNIASMNTAKSCGFQFKGAYLLV